MEVIGEADNGQSAVELVRELLPDLVIMDIAMPHLNGIDATRRVKAELRNVKVIALSMHSDRRFVKGIFKAGASGYVLKDCGFDELLRAIHAVIQGRAYLSPGVTGILIEELLSHEEDKDTSIFSLLTPREREILQAITEGMSTKETASHLNVSAKTVETHRRQIMAKLGVFSIAELTKYAIKEGLTPL
jgi:DNA-binding NarL/FixJ family response regulator